MSGEQRQHVLVLLDGPRELSGRIGGAGPGGGLRTVVSLEDPGEDLARAVIGGWVEREPIRRRLVITEGEMLKTVCVVSTVAPWAPWIVLAYPSCMCCPT